MQHSINSENKNPLNQNLNIYSKSETTTDPARPTVFKHFANNIDSSQNFQMTTQQNQLSSNLFDKTSQYSVNHQQSHGYTLSQMQQPHMLPIQQNVVRIPGISNNAFGYQHLPLPLPLQPNLSTKSISTTQSSNSVPQEPSRATVQYHPNSQPSFEYHPQLPPSSHSYPPSHNTISNLPPPFHVDSLQQIQAPQHSYDIPLQQPQQQQQLNSAPYQLMGNYPQQSHHHHHPQHQHQHQQQQHQQQQHQQQQHQQHQQHQQQDQQQHQHHQHHQQQQHLHQLHQPPPLPLPSSQYYQRPTSLAYYTTGPTPSDLNSNKSLLDPIREAGKGFEHSAKADMSFSSGNDCGSKNFERKITPIITDGFRIQKESNKNINLKNNAIKLKLSDSLESDSGEELRKQNAMNQYLSFYSNAINLSKQLVWASSITDELSKFSKYIHENSTLHMFIKKEANVTNLENEIQTGNYKIEEFYKYIKNFPRDDLGNLSNIFEKLSDMFKDWIELKDSKDLNDYDYNYFLNKLENNGLTQPNSKEKTNIKYYKTSRIPGESVSLQVVPFKPNEKQNIDLQFNSQGTLQPDLTLKVKLVCQHCGSTSTPEWRKGPEDARTLCNACGLFHTKLAKKLGPQGAAEELRNRRERGEQNNRRI